MRRKPDYVIRPMPSGQFWVCSAYAKLPLAICDTEEEAKAERKRLRVSDENYVAQLSAANGG